MAVRPGRPIRSKVAGVAASNDDGTPRQGLIHRFAHAGMPLELRRERNNRYDVNAIGVWMEARVFWIIRAKVQIGYIKGELAESLAPYLDNGGRATARILQLTGEPGEGENTGVNIEIMPG